MTGKEALAQLRRLCLQGLLLGVRGRVGGLMCQDGREQTPDVVVIGRSVAQHCCCLGVELRRAHEVDGSIDLSTPVFERPVQPEGDQVLDPSPDGRRELLVVDDEYERLWLVTEMFINPRDNWVFRERAPAFLRAGWPAGSNSTVIWK